jgi:hypothetical protein
MNTRISSRWRAAAVCALVAWGGTWVERACAHDFALADAPAASEVAAWVPVSEERLDRARAGYDFGNGLVVSLGIDRAVYINGALVTSSRIQIPDIAHITSAQAEALAGPHGAVEVVQNGPGNSIAPVPLSQTMAATVVQNTLDNQNISTVTTLNIAVNTLSLFRGLNLQQSLQTAINSPLGH